MSEVEISTLSEPVDISPVEKLFGSEEISQSILALKKIVEWTPEGETPLYRNKSATLYLQFTPKLYKDCIVRKLTLVHPLSFKRKVCFIGKRLENKALLEASTLTKVLRTIGVKGKIKMIPLSLLQTAVDQKAKEALDELGYLYDTYITDEDITLQAVIISLSRQGKRLVKTDLTDPRKGLEDALAVSFILPTAKKDGFMFRVGHTGMKEVQIKENIWGAMEYLNEKGVFREGLQPFNFIHLKTGESGGVPLYTAPEFLHVEVPEVPEPTPVFKEVDPSSLHLEISKGILALRKMVRWPKRGVKEAVPYSDESTTIYLEVTPACFKPGLSKLTLPNPLNYNREVCFISERMDDRERVYEVCATLKNIGIENPRLIRPRNLKTLMEPKHLSRFVAQFDMHLVPDDEYITKHSLLWALKSARKRLVEVDMTVMEDGLEQVMAESSVFPSNDDTSLRFRVGQTSQPHVWVEENIRAAMEQLDLFFTGGLAAFNYIDLATGESDDVRLFINPSNIAQADPLGQVVLLEDPGTSKSSKRPRLDDELKSNIAQADPLGQVVLLEDPGASKRSKRPRLDDELKAEAGIAALRKIVDWQPPKRANGKPVLPSFTDRTATFYLRLARAPCKQPPVLLTLPHSLSLKRRVCVLMPGKKSKDDAYLGMKLLLVEIGLQGGAKIVPARFGCKWDADLSGDASQWETWAEVYDTLLVDKRILPKVPISVTEAIARVKKLIIPVCLNLKDPARLKENVERALATTPLAKLRNKNAYEMAIAHTGLTDEQIAENIRSVVDQLAKLPAFVEGLQHFSSVQLRLGDSKAVAIYTNPGIHLV